MKIRTLSAVILFSASLFAAAPPARFGPEHEKLLLKARREWGKRVKVPGLAGLRQAQIGVLRHPEWVGARVKRMAAAGVVVCRPAVKAKPLPRGGVKISPVSWWAAWQLSGDWR